MKPKKFKRFSKVFTFCIDDKKALVCRTIYVDQPKYLDRVQILFKTCGDVLRYIRANYPDVDINISSQVAI